MFKDSLYDFLVRRNDYIKYEYERYVQEHLPEHYESRGKHWKVLLQLTWHYRIRKKNCPMIYWDVQQQSQSENINVSKKKVEKVSSQKEPPAINAHKKKIEKNVLNKERPATYAYIDGPESCVCKRTFVHHIVKKYLEYDVVSFDVFDTLIFRPFSNSNDLFYLLETELGIYNFHKIRILCEKAARDKANVLRGNHEVTIQDIYEEIENITGLNKNVGVRAEFELEKKLCYANPYMKRAWDILRSYEKTIYVISDTYYPKTMIVELLESCGYKGFSDVIVSCNCNCTKADNGELYKIILRDLSKKTMLHVGSNHSTDIITAAKVGIETHFYKNINRIGNVYRVQGMTPLISSAYAGIINTRLHCGLKRYSIHYEYGYVYGGLYTLGFCNYMARYTQKHKLDKIIFLSESGDIYSQVFRLISTNISYNRAYWSQISNIILAADTDKYSFISMVIDEGINSTSPITIENLFQSIGLEKILCYLDEYRIHPKETFTSANKMVVHTLLIEHFDEIIDIYKDIIIRIKDYFKDIIGNSKKILLVNVGWSYNEMNTLIQKLINDWKLCDEARVVLCASNDWNADVVSEDNSTEMIQSYMFNSTYNRCLYNEFVNKHKQVGTLLFELFTQTPAPAFKYITNDGKFLFNNPTIENYETIMNVQHGIIDFAKDYISRFADYEAMMNISGHDAYMPFRKVFQDLAYFKKYFSNTTRAELHSSASLNSILKNKKL